jgi:CDP-diacylglycerol--glycerol-3-phosphate 3-phosphatidyltransferase
MTLNLPNLLTIARVLAIPLLVAVYYLPITPPSQDIIATALFVGAALTDWLDGWLARRMRLTSAFGAFLDPVADKLIVCAALVVLVHLDRVVIIIGREITISALREWMAQIGKRASVAVHSIGKFKTIAQLVAIPLLLFHGVLPVIGHTHTLGTWLIYAAAVLTVWSMLYYLRQAWPHLRDR